MPARRRQLRMAGSMVISVQRACTLFSWRDRALRYQGRKTVKDAGMIERMQELSSGICRAMAVAASVCFSAATGIGMSVGRAYRLWRAAGLRLPRREAAQARGRSAATPQSAVGTEPGVVV